jgi:hypothetical protein
MPFRLRIQERPAAFSPASEKSRGSRQMIPLAFQPIEAFDSDGALARLRASQQLSECKMRMRNQRQSVRALAQFPLSTQQGHHGVLNHMTSKLREPACNRLALFAECRFPGLRHVYSNDLRATTLPQKRACTSLPTIIKILRSDRWTRTVLARIARRRR